MSKNRNKKLLRLRSNSQVGEVIAELELEDGSEEETPLEQISKGEGIAPQAEAGELSIYVPIIKIDEAQRLVYGVGFKEQPDHSGEILDYASTKPLAIGWSEETFKRSDGKSRGNVRAMHNNVAAGKLVDFKANDALKQFEVAAKIIDDNEWQKCLEGVYTGFSVGGKYIKRWFDQPTGLMRYTAAPKELSIVDAPCIPGATFQFVKADGTEEVRKFSALQSIAPIAPAIEGEQVQVIEPPAEAVVVNPENIPSGAALAAISNPEAKQIPEPMLSVGKSEEEKLITLGKQVGIARRAIQKLKPEEGETEDLRLYGDPANLGWPCDTLYRCKLAIKYFNSEIQKGDYQGTEWAVLGRRIARLAGAVANANYRYDPSAKKIVRQGQEVEKMDGLDEMAADARTLLNEVEVGGPGAEAKLDQARALLDVMVDQARPPKAGAAEQVPGNNTALDVGKADEAMPASTTPEAKKEEPKVEEKPATAEAKKEGAEAETSVPAAGETVEAKKGVTMDEIINVTNSGNASTPLAKNDEVITHAPPIGTGLGGPLIIRSEQEILAAKLPAFVEALELGAVHKAWQVADGDREQFDNLRHMAFRKMLELGGWNYENRHNVAKEIQLGVGPEDLRKGIASGYAPGIYLQRLVKIMMPLITPWLRRVGTQAPPVGAKTAIWRAQLGLNNFDYGDALYNVPEATSTQLANTTGAGQVIDETALEFISPFFRIPVSNIVTLESVHTMRGYDDPLQIAVIQALTAILGARERKAVGDNSAAIARPAAVTATEEATGGNLPDGNYTLKVTTLTYIGWLDSQVSGYTGNGGRGESNNRASIAVAVTGPDGLVNGEWASVPAAAAYNVYITDGTTERYHSTVTIPRVTVTDYPTAGSAAPTADTTANASGYEGLMSWCERSTVYGQAIPNKVIVDANGSGLTLAGNNSVSEFDEVMRQVFTKWQGAHTFVMCSPNSLDHANKVIQSGTNPSIWRADIKGEQGRAVGGLHAIAYVSKYAYMLDGVQSQVDFMAHPYFPDGHYEFVAERVTYPMARETRGWAMEQLIPLTYFPFGPQTFNYPFGMVVSETLECFAPMLQAAVIGVDISA